MAEFEQQLRQLQLERAAIIEQNDTLIQIREQDTAARKIEQQHIASLEARLLEQERLTREISSLKKQIADQQSKIGALETERATPEPPAWQFWK